MKLPTLITKINSYLKELTIVTIGVLLALVVSNIKENKQAERYYISSIHTINKEVKANSSSLNEVIEKQTRLLDTIKTYSDNNISIGELFSKAGGIQLATLGNTGLEFYTRNQVNSLDFEMMSALIQMNVLSELINSKVDKLMDYLYQNIFTGSKESKMLISFYLREILESETQLKNTYKEFIDEYIESKHNTE